MPHLSNFTSEFFKALAHPLRIRVLDALREGELGVSELSARLKAEQSTLSQHLAVLRAQRLVVNRKAGNQVFYSVRDPILLEVLALMRNYFHKYLSEAQEMLREMSESEKS